MTEHGIIGLTRKCFARKTSYIREIRAIRVRQYCRTSGSERFCGSD